MNTEIKRRYFRNLAGVEFHADIGKTHGTIVCGDMKSVSTVEEIETFISQFKQDGFYEIAQDGTRIDDDGSKK